MGTKGKFVLLIIIIGVVAGFYFLVNLPNRISIDNLQAFIHSKGIWGPIVFFLLYAVTSIIIFPGALLSTTSGAIWGPFVGTLYTVCAATISSVIPFLIARYLGRSFITKLVRGSKIEVCDRFLTQKGFLSIVLLRLIPIFPWDVINYGAGLCSFSFHHYVFATLIGIIPGSLTYNLIGDSLGKPLDKTKIIIIGISITITLCVTFFYQKIRSKSHYLL